MQTPSFFYDGTEKDREFSIVYWVSWTVRCALECNEQLKGYPKKVLLKLLGSEVTKELLKLLGLKDTNGIVIDSVKSWKEWETIDLCFEITINDKEEKKVIKRYAIVIECKMDTKYSEGQLKKCKDASEMYYTEESNGKADFERKYVYLVGRDDENFWHGEVEECINNGFEILTVCELKQAFGDNAQPTTGNDLFDEFWFNYYGCGVNG